MPRQEKKKRQIKPGDNKYIDRLLALYPDDRKIFIQDNKITLEENDE